MSLKTLLLVCVASFTGCESLLPRVDSARLFASQSAAYAGRFRLAYGRWPATVNELEEFTCMPGRADKFGLEQPSCDELIRQPYRMELAPQGADLRMRFIDAVGEPVCTLRVLAPHADVHAEVFPMIEIRTNLFSCTGDGRAWYTADIE